MENIQKISIDLNDNHLYESIYSKQYDQGRLVYFNVTKNGIPISLQGISASFEMKKNDGTVILKTCDISDNDEIIVNLDRNITVFYGNRIPFQLKLIDLDTILTTVTGYLNIEESVVKLDDIESSSDFSVYTDILLKITQQYNDTKQFSENAEVSETNAKLSEINAKNSEINAKESEINASNSAISASNSETNASASETVTIEKATEAANSATSASESANTAINKASEASTSANNANIYAIKSQSYTDGGTGTRENEDIDNAKYYYEQVRLIAEKLNGALLPMGTISFNQLSEQVKHPGYMYNITDEFTTTSEFKEGEGYTYPGGTNVYYTYDGKWDCLAGTFVTGVKGNAETLYRKGNVNITMEDLGYGNVENKSSSDIRDEITKSNIENALGYTPVSEVISDNEPEVMSDFWLQMYD